MSDSSIIEQVIAQLTTLQKEGQSVVSIAAVTRALDGLRPEDAQSFEARKIQLQADIEDFRVRSTAKVETFKTVIDTAKSTLATIILINGSATVTLLTFIGNLAKTGSSLPSTPKALVISTGCFAFGVFFGALATGGMYLTQYSFNEGYEARGYGFRKATVLISLLSLLGFALGVTEALRGFLG